MIIKKKYRYVLVLASREINAESNASAISKEIMSFLGELAYSEANPRIVAQYSPRTFILKTNRHSEKKLMLALSFVKSIRNERIGLYTLKTSGSIKSLISYTKQHVGSLA